jgi:DNA-binding SARP family transcriptional activator
VANPAGWAMTGCAIELICGFRLLCGDRMIELPLGAQRLIAFLALEGAGMTRSYAAEMLWPDSGRRQAAANLRTALWRVRTQVDDDVVRTASGRVSLADAARVDLHDAVDRTRALIDGSADRSSAPEVDADTVRRLSVRLLPGWYDDWVVVQQERWDQLRLHALEAAAEILLGRGQHMLALEASLLAARSELFRESAHRVVIRVYLAEGNWGAAMQHYQEYRRMLRRELNLVPTTAMDELMHPLVTASTLR